MYVCELPAHPVPPFVNVGVTVTVATTGAVVVFTAVKDNMDEVVPLAANPMEVVLFDQE